LANHQAPDFDATVTERRTRLSAARASEFRSLIAAVMKRNGITPQAMRARSDIFKQPDGWSQSYLDTKLRPGQPLSIWVAASLLRILWFELIARVPHERGSKTRRVPSGPDARKIMRAAQLLTLLVNGSDDDLPQEALYGSVPIGDVPAGALPSYLAFLAAAIVRRIDPKKPLTVTTILGAMYDALGPDVVEVMLAAERGVDVMAAIHSAAASGANLMKAVRAASASRVDNG